MAAVEFLSESTFKSKVYNYEASKDWKFEGDKPCIVDFYAEWCGPCKMVAPILDELQKDYEGKLNIYKIDTEKERQLAGMFDIQSIPTLLFVPIDGAPQKAVGALDKKGFKQAIKDVFGIEA